MLTRFHPLRLRRSLKMGRGRWQLFWLGLLLLLPGSEGELRPLSPPLVSACDRFGNPATALATATHQPAPFFSLSDPAALLPAKRARRYAAHTIFLDNVTADHAVAAGFDTVVQVFPWRDLNSRPGHYAWEAGDYMVRMAQQNGLHLVVRLDMPPEWARREGAVPFDLAAYADFVTAVAQRYRGHIAGYVIWNEPNLAAEWSRSGGDLEMHWARFDGRVADPADYVGVLGLAYRRIKAQDPEALVVTAGLAPTNENSPRARDDRDFLRTMMAAGAGNCFDILGVHAYGFGRHPEAVEAVQMGLNLDRLATLHAIAAEHNLNKPIWVKELGYTVGQGNQPWVTPEQQADYLLAALERIEREWPFVALVTVWNLVYGRPPEDEISGYSLLNPDGSPRPAYYRLSEKLLP
jgi:polysaccharide biosynthesis protein PslG